MVERPHKKLGLCVLPEDVITDIIRQQDELYTFELMERVESVDSFSILQTMAEPSQLCAYCCTDTHEFTSLQLRNEGMLQSRVASFMYNGLPSQTSCCKDILTKLATFLFLFPFGHGQYWPRSIQGTNWIQLEH